MGKSEPPHDLRRAYPELDPDREYPPLHFDSHKGKASAAEWETRFDCACAAGFVIHGAIHAAKPELHCVVHTHSLAGMADPSYKN